MVEHGGLPMKSVYLKKLEYEQDVRPDYVLKTRNCLVCKVEFLSEWVGERVCKKCKSRSDWRNGF